MPQGDRDVTKMLILEIRFPCINQLFRENKYCISSFAFVLKNILGKFHAALIKTAGLSPVPV